jgi:hypothetical protein
MNLIGYLAFFFFFKSIEHLNFRHFTILGISLDNLIFFIDPPVESQNNTLITKARKHEKEKKRNFRKKWARGLDSLF